MSGLAARSNSLNSGAEAKPSWSKCVRVWLCVSACAGHTAFVCECVCFSADSQEASAVSDVAALAAFSAALSLFVAHSSMILSLHAIRIIIGD